MLDLNKRPAGDLEKGHAHRLTGYLATSTRSLPPMPRGTTMVLNPRLSITSATYIEIGQIVRSAEGREAATDAAQNMLPALCGVDRLLREKLGGRYTKINGGTACAGVFVAKLMLELGYVAGTRKRCGDDCLTQSAILW